MPKHVARSLKVSDRGRLRIRVTAIDNLCFIFCATSVICVVKIYRERS